MVMILSLIRSNDIGMDTAEVITLSQACELTHKSRLTIRRHILAKTLKAKKRQGQWTLNKQDVMTHFKVSGDGGPDPSVSGVPVNVIEILKDQLAVKDKQIAEINERLREMNIMLHKNQLAITGNDTEDVKDKGTKKKMKLGATDYMVMFAVMVLLYLSWLMVYG